MGRISREQADELAHGHYATEQRRRTAIEAEEEAVKQLTETAKKLPADRRKAGRRECEAKQRNGRTPVRPVAAGSALRFV